jgi:Zn-finger nucleic acid-binding protein
MAIEKRESTTMLCPTCKVALNMSERQGIEIDYCPQCRGVWLDRGELDKIIERSMAAEEGSARPPATEPKYDRDRRDERYRDERYRDDDYKRRRKKSFLGELLDF